MNWSFRGWWRVAVVLTVLWIIAVPYYIEHFQGPVLDEKRWALTNHIVDDHYECIHGAKSADRPKCESMYQKNWDKALELAKQADANNVLLFLLYAFVPAPFFWLLGYVLLITGRWVQNGFTVKSLPNVTPVSRPIMTPL